MGKGSAHAIAIGRGRISGHASYARTASPTLIAAKAVEGPTVDRRDLADMAGPIGDRSSYRPRRCAPVPPIGGKIIFRTRVAAD